MHTSKLVLPFISLLTATIAAPTTKRPADALDSTKSRLHRVRGRDGATDSLSPPTSRMHRFRDRDGLTDIALVNDHRNQIDRKMERGRRNYDHHKAAGNVSPSNVQRPKRQRRKRDGTYAVVPLVAGASCLFCLLFHHCKRKDGHYRLRWPARCVCPRQVRRSLPLLYYYHVLMTCYVLTENTTPL